MSKNSNVKSDSGSQGGGRSGGPKMSEGDWLCTDAECANWNFAWRTSCNRCGAEKASGTSDSGGSSGGSSSYSKKKKLGQEIGKAMAEKSRGLFSADDWQCNKCGNVNWARRHQCNVCNAPRYGEVEERTGYGGGYNDRGVVEYKERIDSDDEWDEFGRKKKKQQRRKENSESDDGPSQSKRRRDERRSSSEREDEEEQERPKKEEVKEVVSKKTKEESSNEEDEEDDDDDDGDLSKYDLSGWGDEDDK
ncbi:hypothetical protein B566_EDAN008993 [Ephemera danica]|nr:hypothetical protein B566_EDAN008993 [Ephemera danica]